MGDSHVGLQARLMSQALRKLAGTLNRTDTICLFTNQLREKIGVMFGNPETTPGGRALKFYSSVRLDIRRIETLKEGVEAFGNRVRVKVVKNKVAPPFKQAEFDIIYGSGISWEGTVLDAGLERKVVTKSGSYFSFGDERLGQGRQNATAFLREHPDVCQAILARIQAELGPEQVGSARLLPAGETGEQNGKVPSRRSRRPPRSVSAVCRPSPRCAPSGAAASLSSSTAHRGGYCRSRSSCGRGSAIGLPLDRPALRLLRRELRRAEALGVATSALRRRDLSSQWSCGAAGSGRRRPGGAGGVARNSRPSGPRRRRALLRGTEPPLSPSAATATRRSGTTCPGRAFLRSSSRQRSSSSSQRQSGRAGSWSGAVPGRGRPVTSRARASARTL